MIDTGYYIESDNFVNGDVGFEDARLSIFSDFKDEDRFSREIIEEDNHRELIFLAHSRRIMTSVTSKGKRTTFPLPDHSSQYEFEHGRVEVNIFDKYNEGATFIERPIACKVAFELLRNHQC